MRQDARILTISTEYASAAYANIHSGAVVRPRPAEDVFHALAHPGRRKIRLTQWGDASDSRLAREICGDMEVRARYANEAY